VRAPVLVLALVAVAALAPAAAADHVYSHRYVVAARAVDDLGRPVPNTQLDLTVAGFERDVCRGFTQFTTDENGDFLLCIHQHAMPRDAEIVFGTPDGPLRFTPDPDTRHTYAAVRLAGAEGAIPDGWDRTFVVTGRLWRETGPIMLDNVPVNGEALRFAPVDVTLTFPDGRKVTKNATTDGYGDYRVAFDVAARPSVTTLVSARSSALNVTAEAPADGAFMRAHLVLAEMRPTLDDDRPPADDGSVEDPRGDAPGSRTPTVPGPGALTIAGAAALAIALARRRARS